MTQQLFSQQEKEEIMVEKNQEAQSYKVVSIHLAQEKYPFALNCYLHAHHDGGKWEINLWNVEKNEHCFKGNLQELVALLLLGLAVKETAEIEAEAEVEAERV